jgi:hypothetical protein
MTRTPRPRKQPSTIARATRRAEILRDRFERIDAHLVTFTDRWRKAYQRMRDADAIVIREWKGSTKKKAR